MKKFKLLAFVAMTLVAVMVLSSCAFTVKDLSKIYNTEYDFKDTPYKSSTEISALTDYEFVTGHQFFGVFKKYDEKKDVTKLALYSFVKNEVIKEYKTDDEVEYSVDFVAHEFPIAVVTATTIPSEEDEEAVVTKTYVDATGNEFLTIDADLEVGTPNFLSEELVIINQTLYTANAKAGTVAKKMSVPATVSTDSMYKVGDYFYTIGDAVIIYDESFVPVATYIAPSFAEAVGELVVMNDGSILVQYVIALPEDAVFYDVFYDGVKYELVSNILSVDGKLKEVSLDYIVMSCVPNFAVYDENDDDNMFVDGFENLACIARIEDKRFDENEDNHEYVIMNNNAKVEKSLMLVDGQIDLPEMIAPDLYLVETVYGAALITGNGEIKHQLTNTDFEFTSADGYFVGETAIYNTEFNMVYDLGANEAEVLGTINETIFVKAGDDESYEIISFCGGKQTSVFTYDEDEDISFTMTEFGYVIVEEDDDETTYTYYNEAGTQLLETERPATVVIRAKDKIVVSVVEGDSGDTETVYYAFTK